MRVGMLRVGATTHRSVPHSGMTRLGADRNGVATGPPWCDAADARLNEFRYWMSAEGSFGSIVNRTTTESPHRRLMQYLTLVRLLPLQTFSAGPNKISASGVC